MTRFIVNGGYPDNAPDAGKSFWRTVTKPYGSPVKVVECLFARIEEYWATSMGRDWALAQAFLPGIDLQFEIARPETLVEQIKACDVFYLRGGNTQRLMAMLKETPGWQEQLAGKTVVGTSAGAEVLCAAYFEYEDSETCEEGFGLIPVKFISHYKSNYGGHQDDWPRFHQILSDCKPELPVLALREGEFAVFEDDAQATKADRKVK